MSPMMKLRTTRSDPKSSSTSFGLPVREREGIYVRVPTKINQNHKKIINNEIPKKLKNQKPTIMNITYQSI